VVFSTRHWRILALLCLFFSGISVGFGQNAQISGLVFDTQKAAIPHATIEAANEATQIKTTATSDHAGLYTIASLPPGKYRVSVSAPGFETQVVDGITVAVAGKISLDVELHPGNVTQSVTVDGSGLQINTTDATVSTVVDRQFVENMPLNGRSFQSLLTLIPGVSVVPTYDGSGYSGEISVNGQRTEENNFTVDGVSANTGVSILSNPGFGGGFSGSTPSETLLGTTQSMISIDALEEFRATTSTYSAEYGRTPGGQFSLTSRSGTNQWHGSAFDYFRNDALDANNWFNNNSGLPRTAERQNDFGGTFGGPIKVPRIYDGTGKTFFFFSYEGLRLQSPQAAQLYGVPSLSFRQSAPTALQPILNAFPIPNGADLGSGIAGYTASYSIPSSLDASSIRIDHHFNDRFSVFSRYSNTPSSILSRSSLDPATLSPASARTQSLLVGTTNMLSSRMSNEFRINGTWNSWNSSSCLDSFGGATPFATSSLPGLSQSSELVFYLEYGLYPGMDLNTQSANQRQVNIIDAISLLLGRHTLKAGIDYRTVETTEAVPPVLEFGEFSTQNDALNNTTSFGEIQSRSFEPRPVYTNFSAFVQDEWKVNPRLNLSFGLRWDLNPAPHDADGNDPYAITSAEVATAQVAPRGTPLWKTTYENFAPRLGLAYQAHQSPGHETVLRSGIGVFYDTGNTEGSQGYNGIGMSATSTVTGSSLPFTQKQISSVGAPSVEAPYSTAVYGFAPHLQLPYTLQWNAALEQKLGEKQSLTFSYVGSSGRRLLVHYQYAPSKRGNPDFASSTRLSLTTNAASSNYNGLQVQFQRTIAHGLQVLAAYTWSHSIDDASSNFFVYELLRANSDFDNRHNCQAGMTYDIPGNYGNPWLSKALRAWALDGRISARSALPVDVLVKTGIDPQTGVDLSYQPNRTGNQPLYLSASDAPGGRVINYAAFSVATDANGNAVEGDSGRNLARGFDAIQTDIALRREFHLRAKLNLQLRAEAFNLFNHPIFGAIYNKLSEGPTLFGQAYNTLNGSLGGLNPLYQVGGPRSLQLALKLHF